jgi:hypothetical protein
MATTYELISSVTVGSGGAASMSFTSIPATYTDLSLFISSRDTAPSQATDNFKIYFNSANSNRSMKTALGRAELGTVQTFGTSNSQTGYTDASTALASTFGNALYYIPNYRVAQQKSFGGDSIQEDNVSATQFGIDACLWNSTSAITSITIEPNYASQTFVQYTTAYLYGISNA